MKENRTTNYKQYLANVKNENVIGLLIEARNILVASDTANSADVVWDINQLLKKFKTKEVCPRCGEKLYLSDLEGYDYVCYECNENF